MAIKKDTKWFIEKAMKKHGEKYNYNESIYLGWDKKIKILCPQHGIFEQLPTKHINKHGCNMCGREEKRLCDDEFIERSKNIHNNFYDYSLVEFKNTTKPINIICPSHGLFVQKPNKHLRGHGCRKCAGNYKKNTIDFIKDAKLIHLDKYNYSLVKYIKNDENVKIICEKHGTFNQLPLVHLSGGGCPKCKNSRSEWKIEKLLIEYKIEFETQKRFSLCRDKRPLPFDFYLQKSNICIEFDGIHHFKNMEHWSKEHLNDRQKKDKIKNNFCINNNLKLIRIKYNENIKERLIKEKIIHL